NNCHFCQNTPAEKQKIKPRIVLMNFNNASMLDKVYNAALRCERRLAILERSETAKRCESLLNALLCTLLRIPINWR
ncbi:hypothetical protein BTT97_25080, partial [Vibrio vulnificus]